MRWLSSPDAGGNGHFRAMLPPMIAPLDIVKIARLRAAQEARHLLLP